jgi:hypothetical protein
MTTPKLKLHRLSDERPAPSDQQYLTFFEVDGGTQLHQGSLEAGNSNYIKGVSLTDSHRFFLSHQEVSQFLLEHDLLRRPEQIDYEAKAYAAAFEKWLKSPARSCGTEVYDVVRTAFIRAHVERAGFAFSTSKYRTLC